jgi:hypothetical protein
MAPLPGWERAPVAFWRKALFICRWVSAELDTLAREA